MIRSAGVMMKILHDDIRAVCNREFAQYDLTMSQVEVLGYIFRSIETGEEINQIDIQNQFSLSNPTVTGILKRIEKKGYIQRTRSSQDARFKKVEITQAGIQLANELKEKAIRMDALLTQNFTDEDFEKFSYLMEKMRKNINEQD